MTSNGWECMWLVVAILVTMAAIETVGEYVARPTPADLVNDIEKIGVKR